MFRGRKENLYLLVLLLIAVLSDVTLAGETGSVFFCADSHSTNSAKPADFSIDFTQIDQPYSSSIASIGAELLTPPSSGIPAGETLNSSSGHEKVMPAVPAAVFMVLTGFICVSLVRDRKVWLAAFVGLLYLGQFGAMALPKLASCLQKNGITKVVLRQNRAGCPEVDSRFRVRSEVDGTAFIGLLRKLSSIPGDAGSSNFIMRANTASVCDFAAPAISELRTEFAYTFAQISSLLGFSNELFCLVRSTRHLPIPLTPFLINNPAHGPPFNG